METDGKQLVIDELEQQLLVDLVTVLHQDDEYIEALADSAGTTAYTLAIIMDSFLSIGHTLNVLLDPKFKEGVSQLRIHPGKNTLIQVGTIPHKVYIKGSSKMIDLPALIVGTYLIPYKYIIDVQLPFNGRKYTLFDFIDPRHSIDMYKEWIITGDIETSSDNLIYIDFKNPPIKR